MNSVALCGFNRALQTRPKSTITTTYDLYTSSKPEAYSWER